MANAQQLTPAEVSHVAKLARLELSPERVETYRSQLTAVLGHIAKLNEIDMAGVEPMAHPFDAANRLSDDTPSPSMPIEDVLLNAPATEGRFLAVPKVLADEE